MTPIFDPRVFDARAFYALHDEAEPHGTVTLTVDITATVTITAHVTATVEMSDG